MTMKTMQAKRILKSLISRRLLNKACNGITWNYAAMVKLKIKFLRKPQTICF